MNIRDEDIQAYVDGELAGADAARIEAAVAADVLVAARVERERRLRAQVRGAFDGVLAEPVPQRLVDALRAPTASNTADVVELRTRREAKAPSRWRVPAFAIAASVAVLAAAAWLRTGTGPVSMDTAGLVARGPLAQALERGLASEPLAGTAIGLTFRDADGRICRTFAEPRMSGLACRENDAWRLEVVARRGQAEGEVRQASTALAPEVQAAVDARLDGDVFDAAQERSSRDAGWR
ncbi:anti-sigma factor family protein [Lysobacter humi (ex Lee et al. 2017)]